MMQEKIYIVGDFKKTSGVTTYILNAFSNIVHKYELIAINISGDTALDVMLSKRGWRVIHIFPANQNLCKHLTDWHHLLHKENLRNSIVYFNYSASWNILPVLGVKLIAHARVIMHAHNTSFGTDASGFKLKLLTVAHFVGRNIISPFLSARFAASEAAAKWLFPKAVVRSGMVDVINNGINLDRVKYNPDSREQIRKDKNLLRSTFVVGNVGVLEPRKNQTRLVRIFSEIHKQSPNSRLWILGDGTERKRLIALVDELKISEYVDLLGNQDDMPKYYSGMDAFVMTSRIEGLSVAYLEAQAEGLPVFMAKGLPLGNPVSRLVSTIDLSMNDSDIARQILSARSTPRLPGTREVADNGYDANNLKTILESKIDEVFRS